MRLAPSKASGHDEDEDDVLVSESKFPKLERDDGAYESD
jgi:hypothetical protein